MAGVTTNNSWDYPTSTDYVKDGATAIQTLATDIDTSVGTGLLAWTTYTPTLSGTGWSLGNGTLTGRSAKLGKIVCTEIMLTFGSTTVAGSAVPTVSLPHTANTTIQPNPAHVTINDTSASTTYIGQGSLSSTGVTANVGVTSGSYSSLTGLAAGVPITYATGDEVRWSCMYEAA